MNSPEKPTVLLVDDVPANIQLLAGFLSDLYEIKVATSGKRAVELATSTPQPDLILLDIEMPEMNGYEVCQKLKNQTSTSSIPIIFITAKDDDDDEEFGLELGAVDYITKPVRPAIVLARVKTQVTIKKQQDQLKKMALYDQLTGIYNRHYLMETANLKIAKSRRHSYPISLVVVDIDHFKSINDNNGHDVGDKVLIAVSKLFNQTTRKEDIAARFGGEEFVLLLDHCSIKSAQSKVESIRKQVEALKPESLKVTASFGVAELQSGEALDNLIKRADDALYKAKQTGRNKVVLG